MSQISNQKIGRPSPWVRSAFIACILAFCSAWPASGYAQPLEDIQVNVAGDDAQIKLLFDRPLRYERHFPWNRGDTLVVFLLQGKVKSSQEEVQRMTKRPPAGSKLPLRDVTYEQGPDGPKIVVRFQRSVSFELKASRDNRSLSIYLKGMAGLVRLATGKTRQIIPDEKQPAVKRKTSRKRAKTEQPQRHHFVLNLESSLRPIKSVLKLPASVKKGRTAYISKVVIEGRTWRRLRLGYFATREEASRARNLVKKIYPSTWIDLASPKEQAFARGRRVAKVAKPTKRKRVIIAPPAPSVAQKGGAVFLERGKEALKRKRNKQAIRFFIQALQTGDKNIAPEAQELLGLARERVGQKRMAINEYKAYLKQYAKEEGADRVRKRLDNLAGVSKKRKLRRRSKRRRSAGWRYYGTWSQTYYRGNSKVDTETTTGGTVVNEPTLTNLDQSSLISNLDFTVRNRTKESDNRIVFSGDHRYNFLEPKTEAQKDKVSDGRVRKAYVEHKDKEYGYFVKLGRQSGRYGALGRFDGVLTGFNPFPKFRVNAIGGQPDDLVAEDSNRTFWGLSVDAGTFGGNWAGNLYYMNANIDGFVDRQAVGTELRFFSSKGSAFTLADYDLYFDELNIFLIQGNWQAPTKTNINILYDFRKNPSLQQSNALLSEPVQSIDDLLINRTEEEILQLARDRTAESQVYALSIVQQIGKKYQLGVDFNRVNVSGLPATLTDAGTTLPASQGTGNIDTVVLKGIALGMLVKNEVSLLGVSNTKSETFDVNALFLTERLRFLKNWRVDFNYRWSKQDNEIGSESTRSTPSIRLDYRWDSVTFDFEYGQETTNTSTATQEDDSTRNFYSLGYRWDF